MFNIIDTLKYFFGTETSERKWVLHEIEQAWNAGKPMLGIYIHNLSCPRKGKCTKGKNPFEKFIMDNSNKKLSEFVTCYNPIVFNTYNEIKNNIDDWIEEAIKTR